ncbi:hypothetical protein B0H16DRAFT_1692854 [Mycena metata]|uniref:Uncharacterized protein n=1 Tax=Mycena metata TaxID=1033252 RepID=A0AAD7INR2_9AGAR|nr:hypothetical protein B0H16DRAFT_1692854 [Mycena metata]
MGTGRLGDAHHAQPAHAAREEYEYTQAAAATGRIESRTRLRMRRAASGRGSGHACGDERGGYASSGTGSAGRLIMVGKGRDRLGRVAWVRTLTRTRQCRTARSAARSAAPTLLREVGAGCGGDAAGVIQRNDALKVEHGWGVMGQTGEVGTQKGNQVAPVLPPPFALPPPLGHAVGGVQRDCDSVQRRNIGDGGAGEEMAVSAQAQYEYVQPLSSTALQSARASAAPRARRLWRDGSAAGMAGTTLTAVVRVRPTAAAHGGAYPPQIAGASDAVLRLRPYGRYSHGGTSSLSSSTTSTAMVMVTSGGEDAAAADDGVGGHVGRAGAGYSGLCKGRSGGLTLVSPALYAGQRGFYELEAAEKA